MSGPEYEKCERPFVDQLVSMGWKVTTGNLDEPSVTGRESFREVLILDDLRRAIRRINLNERDEEWIDDARMATAVSALQRYAPSKLMEANQHVTGVILGGTQVEGLPGWDGERAQTVHFIDWDHPENNIFRVVNQFRVDEPGGHAKEFVVPDLVLFVNGIPLGVVECKDPATQEPIEEAINQLQRYSNQREWVEGDEGNERLFHFNQVLIATCFDRALLGTISAKAVHYLEWKDTSPVPTAEVAVALGKEGLSSQEMLVAGVLRPAHLLNIVRHFMLFTTEGGTTIKIAPRYQQFRAVEAAVRRMLEGKTRHQDGEHDRRGGIVWHTQGSGKSLSMVFLVRRLRTIAALRRFKVVLVTDRKDLERQLKATAALTGETVKVARSTTHLKAMLAEKGPGLVFAMIQKYREPDADDDEGGEGGIKDTDAEVGEFPVLNEDGSILVMVDEAHRSHASALHANLLKALPNACRIGFTGTPILMGARKRTHEIFGDFIDRYTIKQSEMDGATVPILYEGRTAEGAVAAGGTLDEVFEDMFKERTPEEMEAIKRKYGTKGNVLEATKLIEAKARNMFRHYVECVLPNGFKAQVVAVSRRAALRYGDALRSARDEMVRDVEALDPKLLDLAEDARAALPATTQGLLRAHRFLATIKALEFAPIISGSNNDDPAWSEWSDPAKVEARIERFKKRLVHDDPKKADPLAFIVVKSMLLTGFDAPIEQVMYLDRPIQQHEILQAIARVNRTAEKKKAGLVVDYYGVAQHLSEALAVYSEEDVKGALRSLKDEIPVLRDRHRRVVALFTDHGVQSIADEDQCVHLLRDERLRAEFQVKLRMFLEALEVVLPRPEALPFVKGAKILGSIQLRARNLYRTGARPIGKEVGEKVRALIDEHVISLGIDPKIPPVEITDVDFASKVDAKPSPRAKASEMEHALRYHIRRYKDEDPAYYKSLSERLGEILVSLKDRWDDLVAALGKVVEEVRTGRKVDETGLDPETQAPFLGILREEVLGRTAPAPEMLTKLCHLTVDLVDHVRQEVRLVDFHRNAHAQEVLRKWIVQHLDDQNILPYERLPAVAGRLLELSKAIRAKLL